ncbi:MAG: 4Fe-4S dicluster domain-containing protein [bacterium]|nr:4Fe-4S dicluster domain-containing protein [bacterium]
MSAYAMLTDTTLCIGCEACVDACKKVNGLGPDRLWPEQKAIDDLSATRYTTILRRPGPRYVRQQCRHCVDPACASACLVGAMHKTPEGPVVYDSGRCMGCRYCMVACPYGIPRYDWNKAVPYVRKCTMCYDRLKAGKLPACEEACPEKATIFGEREALLKVARQRLRDNPRKYVQRIYGETEVGGTSVLMISDIPLDFLAWKPRLADQPLPQLTWAALSKVPPVVIGVGGLMAGIYWVIGRRMKMQALAAAAAEQAAQAAEDPRAGEKGRE